MSSELLECPTPEVLLDLLRAASHSHSLASDDAQECAKVARECGVLAAQAFHRAATMGLERHGLLAGLRDRIMDEDGLKKIPATDAARERPEYVAHQKEAEGYETMAQHFAVHRDYYRQRADLLMKEVG